MPYESIKMSEERKNRGPWEDNYSDLSPKLREVLQRMDDRHIDAFKSVLDMTIAAQIGIRLVMLASAIGGIITAIFALMNWKTGK
jgi:hypothetical protein